MLEMVVSGRLASDVGSVRERAGACAGLCSLWTESSTRVGGRDVDMADIRSIAARDSKL